jgi:hypothetical protein
MLCRESLGAEVGKSVPDFSRMAEPAEKETEEWASVRREDIAGGGEGKGLWQGTVARGTGTETLRGVPGRDGEAIAAARDPSRDGPSSSGKRIRRGEASGGFKRQRRSCHGKLLKYLLILVSTS